MRTRIDGELKKIRYMPTTEIMRQISKLLQSCLQISGSFAVAMSLLLLEIYFHIIAAINTR